MLTPYLIYKVGDKMIATLYKNLSDERYVDKQLVTLHSEVTCIFKDESDVYSPTIKLDHNLTGNVNYVYLNDLGRYYFVRDKRLLHEGVELDLECDVLTTYKNDIRSNYAIIARNENAFNLYQDDPKWKLYAYTAIRTVPFPSGFDMSKQEFILGVAGGEVV